MCDLVHIRILGSGAYGTVFLVKKKSTDKKYALKLTKRCFCSQGKAGISPNEYTILFNIKHRNLSNAIAALSSPTYSLCYPSYKSGILSELALKDLDKLKPPSANKNINVAKILYDIACGVEALHEAGYYHLDIKAANCLLYPDDTHQYRAVLSDFGLALHISKKDCNFLKCTVTHRPPEIKNGEIFELTPYIDVFSFGVLMAELTVLEHCPYESGLSDEENIQRNIKVILYECAIWRSTVNDFVDFIRNTNDAKAIDTLNSYWGGIGAKAMLQIISQIEMALSVNPLKRGTIKEHREMLEETGKTEEYIDPLYTIQRLNEFTDEDFRLYVIMRDIMKSKTCSDFPVRMLFSAFHLYMMSKNDPNVISGPRARSIALSTSRERPQGHLAFAFLSVASNIYDIEFYDDLYFIFKNDFPEVFPETNQSVVETIFCDLREIIEKCQYLNNNFNAMNAFDTCKSKQEVVNLVNSNDNSLLKNIYYKNNVLTQTEKVGNDVMHLTMKDVEANMVSSLIQTVRNYFAL